VVAVWTDELGLLDSLIKELGDDAAVKMHAQEVTTTLKTAAAVARDHWHTHHCHWHLKAGPHAHWGMCRCRPNADMWGRQATQSHATVLHACTAASKRSCKKATLRQWAPAEHNCVHL
jgi:hypothetical protein